MALSQDMIKAGENEIAELQTQKKNVKDARDKIQQQIDNLKDRKQKCNDQIDRINISIDNIKKDIDNG